MGGAQDTPVTTAMHVCLLHNGHGARLHPARPGGVRHGEGARLQLSSACIREQPTWAWKGMDGMDGIVQTRSQPLNPSHIRMPAMAKSGHRQACWARPMPSRLGGGA